MLDVGWQELLLIAVVALVVIGPKDMPVAMRTMARALSKVRGLSREFQHGVAEMMREAELDELRRKVESAGRINLKDEFTSAVDPSGSLRKDLQLDPGPPHRPGGAITDSAGPAPTVVDSDPGKPPGAG